MTAPRKRIGVEIVKPLELTIGAVQNADGDPDGISLEFSREDCEGAPVYIVKLDIEAAVSMIDALVHSVAEMRGYTRPDPGAGPLSSTY